MATWRGLVSQEMSEQGELWADVVSNTMTSEEMDVEFYAGYGSAEGIDFTVWTEKRVYFPTEYDGAEGVSSVARNPDGKPTRHVG